MKSLGNHVSRLARSHLPSRHWTCCLRRSSKASVSKRHHTSKSRSNCLLSLFHQIHALLRFFSQSTTTFEVVQLHHTAFRASIGIANYSPTATPLSPSDRTAHPHLRFRFRNYINPTTTSPESHLPAQETVNMAPEPTPDNADQKKKGHLMYVVHPAVPS